MKKFTICCSPVARDAAERWKRRLHRNLGFHSLIVAVAGTPIVETWEEGGKTDATLLVLDRETAPAPFCLDDWQGLRGHDGNPPIAFLKREECAYPKLLERHARFLPFDDERAIERWLAKLLPDRPISGPAPSGAAVPEGWWRAVVDTPGTLDLPASESDAVQQLAHDCEDHFEAVAWIVCGDRAREAVEGEIAYRTTGQRVLVVLDHVPDDLPLELPAGRHSFVLLRGHAPAAPLAFPSELRDYYENPVPLDRRRNLLRSPKRREADASKLVQNVFRHGPCDEWIEELRASMRYGFPAAAFLAAARWLRKQERLREAAALLKELAHHAQQRCEGAAEQDALDELRWVLNGEGLPKEAQDSEQMGLF